ncbi:S1 RNA-binding domain-containing protein [Ruminococcus sp.]|uniref:S1 RNA-binding domain-containing protein n=1 Tax=Ruminococcus sp. TaxID=41978 RepID=UPI0025D75E37|nr:S1 RNA-binding domain-containing protein [Ruminococcus sp.]
MNNYLPEGSRFHTAENQAALHSVATMEHAMYAGTILEARAILCDSNHDLTVQLPCMKGRIPREEGAMGIAEGTTRDIALIARAGKPVCFRILRIENDKSGEPIAILSRRSVQEECWAKYLSQCRPGDIIPARVTHLERFGAFMDIGCGIPSLLPIDTISVSRIAHPRDRFTVGQSIRAIVRQVEPNRIHLTHRELLGTWEENAAQFSAGQTVAGIIRSVESYGVFVELTPNLAGLAEPHEGVSAGQCASVYIKAILPEKMKVKLILIDAFDHTDPPAPMQYFIQDDHIDRWQYTPEKSGRLIETVFTEQ